jgi:hypothetical protein
MEPVHKTIKKRHSLVKRLLKWTVLTFSIVLFIFLVVPYFLEKSIKKAILNEANLSLDADMSIGKVHLDLFSAFPNLSISVKDVTISGRGEFVGVDLLTVGTIEAELALNLFSQKEMGFKNFALREVSFDLRINKAGQANFEILKNEAFQKTKAESVDFSLSSYSIENANFNFTDERSELIVMIGALNHNGSIDFNQEVSTFDLSTSIASANVFKNGVPFLMGLTLMSSNIIHLEDIDGVSRFSFLNNELRINDLAISQLGSIESHSDHLFFDITWDTSNSDFKSFLSCLPFFYSADMDSIQADGEAELNAFLKGKLSSTEIPEYRVELSVQNAQFSLPKAEEGFHNINMDLLVNRSNEITSLEFKKLDFDFLKDRFRATLFINDWTTDAFMKLNVQADLFFDALHRVVPIMKRDKIQGSLNTNFNVEGPMDALFEQRVGAFDADGFFKLIGFRYLSSQNNKLTSPLNIDVQLNRKNFLDIFNQFKEL